MRNRRLGPYTIVAPLGAGGMGEVYRARDSKLGRDVAIKILPSHFTADPERRSRFAREARLLATLNHPHIGAIYGLEETDGVAALVLELVEGPTLADRLERGPLPIADALSIARQIAEALDAAHEKGIVHRDLKPANVVLQGPSGSAGQLRAKVLDFGLAKSMAVGLQGDLTQRPGSLDGTEEGRILGTPAYMSPEQARGQAVDKRTDIWAFGCVLYEMLTGRRAFDGDTVTDTLVRVLEREPEWTALPAATPEPVRKLLRRCLQKDPGRRVRDIGDVRLELDEAPDRPSQTPAPRGRGWWALGLAALVIAALGVSSGRLLTRSDPAHVLRPQRLTDLVGLEETPALSPDGQMIAFTAAVNGKRQVFVQALQGGGNPLPLTFDDADHQFPRWTPESNSLVYFSPGHAWRQARHALRNPRLGRRAQNRGAQHGGGGCEHGGPPANIFPLGRQKNRARHRQPRRIQRPRGRAALRSHRRLLHVSPLVARWRAHRLSAWNQPDPRNLHCCGWRR